MTVLDKVIELVERFDYNIEAYKQGKYKEAQVCSEFIEPLFKELGWDVHNEQGYAEAYKDVIHEDAIKVGWGTKAPDYCFRIGGVRKFFIEAKKPSVDIKGDIHPAFQLRRYAWSAKLPLSILTDFEEFAVYDTRIKPNKNDKASNARVMYLTFRDYPEKWEEISSIFSHDSILKGSFDKYVESGRKKRGTAEVDDAFLTEIESWRDLLARNIALRNPQLENRVLNDVVQKTIDRILFLRICEDRGVENYGQLMALLNGTNIYSRLSKLFLKADERYNSGLFHFSSEKNRQDPDEISLQLSIDDKHLKDIIKRLYYPESPYEFSVLPADILGQVYERFLGKVIRLTPGHRAVVEDKPEVRKAGGVYYTPTYIVDYIVENTVGKLLEGKTPRQAEKLKILDPACGSGSFLLGAYQYLMDWHLKEYTAENPEKYLKSRFPKIYQIRSGDWRLSTTEKKRILLNNIYGVDIDTQAVEVTKLSLLLKVLEGETDETLKSQLKLFHERALPDLGNNIKCGNSLIGSDFYEGQQLCILTEDEIYRINAFDWEKEFPEIWSEIWSEPSVLAHASTQLTHSKNSKTGGFDVVIGNPPWISLTGKFGDNIHSQNEIDYLIRKFKGNTYMPNMYEYFVAQGINITKSKCLFSFVVPDRLGFNDQFIQLRKRILEELQIVSLVYKVPFPGITTDTLIFVFQIGNTKKDYSVSISEYGKNKINRFRSELLRHPTYKFEYFEDTHIIQIINKIDSMTYIAAIEKLCSSTSGFGGKSKLIQKTRTSKKQIPTFKGRSIGRYYMCERYWFEFKKQNITGRTTDPKKLGAFPKILLRKTGDRIIANYDNSGVFPEQSLYFLYNNRSELDFKYLLGVLNSSLLTFYYRAKCITNIKSIAQVKKKDLDQLPIRVINFSNPKEKSKHDKMVLLVDQMLDLNKLLSSAQTQHEKTLFQRQIEATDQQIDQLVYELYELTDEEIKVVEQS